MRSKLSLVAAAFLAVGAVKPANAQASLALTGLAGAAAVVGTVAIVGAIVAASNNNSSSTT